MFNILIIEDEDLYRKFLLKILQKSYHCDTARSAEEARALLLHNSYDIVLYDLRLPGISGKDLVQWVRREIDPDIVNIVITGFEDDWTPVQATEENIFYYLRKGDFQPDELTNIVNNAAAVRKMRIEERVSFSDQLATEGIVEKMKKKCPDLAILDVMFPEDNSAGFSLAREIKEQEQLKNVPLLMLTAVNQEYPLGFSKKDIDETWLPVSDFLEKPIDLDVLKKKVEELLQK